MAQPKLPTSLTTKSELMRLKRELNGLNDFFAGTAARAAGSPQQPPKTTKLLDQLASANELNLLEPEHRKQLTDQLDWLLKNAPMLHISFATEPTPKAIEPIVTWLRQNIHPLCLVQTGVAPAIAAGCILRTPNKMFDMSMRVYLQNQGKLLNQLIAGAISGR